MSSVDAGMLKF